ncbi:TPA: hypothetical protein ACPG11_001562 [Haemophilus influenzae 10810]|uniref:Uncharacterized protein n=1 Tax=Haemophilus influenzae TaxID=727 RepID=A0AAX3ITS3_HAEIF|nr:hypothetical protein [Haemophilus influenzae]QEQ59085.1 hypothetical protein F1541_08675 [Haemophilus influenzae biotype aegyptius]KIP47454.1 hypothetical protein SU56_01230 [Haemophilus influenzae]KMZ26651.1 hypothetical protein ABN76_07010 [Haemophilus influenzae]MCK8791842.1 hypothetical protein [Haemophilus influenzae]MCK8918322.1 hypothetical protein [Haemophilus influenzae]
MNLNKYILKIDQDLNSPDALLLLNTHYKQLNAQEKELFILALMGKVIELKTMIEADKYR